MKKWLFVFTAMILGALTSMAAGIDGKWKASIEGPDGKMEIVFTFKVNGNVLTGTVSTPMGEMPISNGKIEGKEFSFDVDMGGNLMPHKCTLDGDVIKMKMTGGPGGPEGGGSNESGDMILQKVVE